MVELFERLDDFVVDINHYPYFRTEVIDEEKGIVRVYGRDGDNEKINSVLYSKPYYTRGYIEENILKEYEDCPLCKIGQSLYVPPKKDYSNILKSPIVIASLIGVVSIPLILYFIKKKLT